MQIRESPLPDIQEIQLRGQTSRLNSTHQNKETILYTLKFDNEGILFQCKFTLIITLHV
jgi:hypothetical protein